MKTEATSFLLQPVGVVRSAIKNRGDGPKQGREGAPAAWIEIDPRFAESLQGIEVGDEIIVITWLHLARRDELRVHPRGETTNPLIGVFATRSPDRPNPLGLHRVRVLEAGTNGLTVSPLEAIDGTPVLDIKPTLADWNDS